MYAHQSIDCQAKASISRLEEKVAYIYFRGYIHHACTLALHEKRCHELMN
jgi:hypothetical protein